MGQPRRSFTPECKPEAVDLCRRSGQSECQLARELGIPQPTCNRWMRHVATAPLGTKSFPATEGTEVLRREVEPLRVDLSGERNTCLQYSRWRLKSQRLSRTLI